MKEKCKRISRSCRARGTEKKIFNMVLRSQRNAEKNYEI